MDDWAWEAEARLLYALVVAGKSAKFADGKVRGFLGLAREGESPFALVRRIDAAGDLDDVLRGLRMGNYGKLERGFREAASCGLDLRTCGPADLEKIHGVGPKTSRFWLMWVRPEEKHAALDVHVLRWMRSLGYDAPRATPSGKAKYARLEAAFLEEARKRGKTPRELDFEIWQAGSGYDGTIQGKD